jgi:hypothetical protein
MAFSPATSMKTDNKDNLKQSPEKKAGTVKRQRGCLEIPYIV